MKHTWLILISALLVSACSESSDTAGSGGSGGQAGSSGQGGSGGVPGIAYPLVDCDPLVPEFCGYPFPSNVYAVQDSSTATGRRVSFSDELVLGSDPAPWNKSDGFSAGSPIMTFLPGIALGQFAGPDDIEASLSDTSPTILLDAESGERVPHFAQIDIRATTAEQRSTMIRPVVRLRDNARYIVAFRNLTNEDGATIDPSPAFADLRDGTSSDDESVEARRDLYEDIFERLADAGWSRDEVQIAWDFNTASDANNTEWLVHMRDTAFGLVEDGIEYTIESVETEFPGDGGRDVAKRENIAFLIRGTFKAPLFMTSAGAGSILVFGDDGLPAVNQDTPWVDVPFSVMIPKSATAEDPAAIVEYGHGLLGSRSQIEADHFSSFMNEYNYTFCGTDLIGMSSSDELVIGASLGLGNLSGCRPCSIAYTKGFSTTCFSCG